MRKTFFKIGVLFALFAVIFGAFGAHALKEHLTPEHLISFETGVRYQFYHAFALMIISLLMYKRKNKFIDYAGWLFTAGTILFSGSIYLLALRPVLNFSGSWLGPVTPLGGSLLIIGWAMLLVSTFQDNEYKRG
ncbi:MAG: DUF423 domain-containing protein [Saprospiraceae bacterium]|nr:DUF423 domain-containing protein [Saprospiraceae bacterium]MCB9322137.1 DUF423 domain-containing protein [Lewinellaceae bacterium]